MIEEFENHPSNTCYIYNSVIFGESYFCMYFKEEIKMKNIKGVCTVLYSMYGWEEM